MQRLEFDASKKKLIERADAFSLPMPGYSFSPDAMEAASPEARMACVVLGGHMCKSWLGDNLTQWFGKRDEMVAGKYRKASAFYFDAGNGDIVVAVCEKGHRGSSWYWIPADFEEANMIHGPGNVIMRQQHAPAFWETMVLELADKFQGIDPRIDVELVHGALATPNAKKRTARP